MHERQTDRERERKREGMRLPQYSPPSAATIRTAMKVPGDDERRQEQCLRCLLKKSIVGVAKGRPFCAVIMVICCCFVVTFKLGEPYCGGYLQ